ncbi:MAG: UPF0280 family protein [Candidatus Omnitrophica bacterium]|nr:UPF0280 family protein [Candidatus Omnitrophota bacterium]MCM8802799.1 UPF0280 family protein [Candidatus Omnitrophota bacterium]
MNEKIKERFYRSLIQKGNFYKFEVEVEETNILVIAKKNLKKEIREEVIKQREILKNYIKQYPEFLFSFSPISTKSDQEIIKLMSESSFLTKTGPMASVAGAIAEVIGKKFVSLSDEIIIENGGDIFAKMNSDFIVGIYAGKSPFSMKIGIKLKKREIPYGIATSSGTVGHSISFGKADAVTVVSPSATFSDGAATYFGNLVKDKIDKELIISELKNFVFIEGIVIIKEKKIFLWGDIELIDLINEDKINKNQS